MKEMLVAFAKLFLAVGVFYWYGNLSPGTKADIAAVAAPMAFIMALYIAKQVDHTNDRQRRHFGYQRRVQNRVADLERQIVVLLEKAGLNEPDEDDWEDEEEEEEEEEDDDEVVSEWEIGWDSKKPPYTGKPE